MDSSWYSNQNTSTLPSEKGGTHLKTVMMYHGTPIVIPREVELRQFDRPIGVVRLFTLYAKALDDIKYTSHKKFPIYHDVYYQFLGLNGNCYSLQKINEGCYERYSKTVRKASGSYKEDLILENLQTYGPKALSDHYVVCNMNKKSGCNCKDRVHGIRESDASDLCFNIKFFPGRPYYVFGYGMFSNYSTDADANASFNEYALLVYMDGHIYFFHNSFIASVMFYNGLPAEDRCILNRLKATMSPLLSPKFLEFLRANTNYHKKKSGKKKHSEKPKSRRKFDKTNLSALAVRDLRGHCPVLRQLPISSGRRDDSSNVFIMDGCPDPIIPPDSCFNYTQFTNYYLSRYKYSILGNVITMDILKQARDEARASELKKNIEKDQLNENDNIKLSPDSKLADVQFQPSAPFSQLEYDSGNGSNLQDFAHVAQNTLSDAHANTQRHSIPKVTENENESCTLKPPSVLNDEPMFDKFRPNEEQNFVKYENLPIADSLVELNSAISGCIKNIISESELKDVKKTSENHDQSHPCQCESFDQIDFSSQRDLVDNNSDMDFDENFQTKFQKVSREVKMLNLPNNPEDSLNTIFSDISPEVTDFFESQKDKCNDDLNDNLNKESSRDSNVTEAFMVSRIPQERFSDNSTGKNGKRLRSRNLNSFKEPSSFRKQRDGTETTQKSGGHIEETIFSDDTLKKLFKVPPKKRLALCVKLLAVSENKGQKSKSISEQDTSSALQKIISEMISDDDNDEDEDEDENTTESEDDISSPARNPGQKISRPSTLFFKRIPNSVASPPSPSPPSLSLSSSLSSPSSPYSPSSSPSLPPSSPSLMQTDPTTSISLRSQNSDDLILVPSLPSGTVLGSNFVESRVPRRRKARGRGSWNGKGRKGRGKKKGYDNEMLSVSNLDSEWLP